MKHVFRKVVIAIVLVLVVGGSVAWYVRRDKAQAVPLRTATVTRGDLVVTIGATGTVEPEEVIDVGAQVAGQIISFGKDANGNTVDYTSPVEPNMVLAQIDDTLYRAQAAQSAAQVQQARAAVQTAQANLKQNQARLYQAQRDWDRAQKLGIEEAFFYRVAGVVGDMMKDAYPELLESVQRVARVVKDKEHRYATTFQVAERMFHDEAKAAVAGVLAGEPPPFDIAQRCQIVVHFRRVRGPKLPL